MVFVVLICYCCLGWGFISYVGGFVLFGFCCGFVSCMFVGWDLGCCLVGWYGYVWLFGLVF